MHRQNGTYMSFFTMKRFVWDLVGEGYLAGLGATAIALFMADDEPEVIQIGSALLGRAPSLDRPSMVPCNAQRTIVWSASYSLYTPGDDIRAQRL